MSRLFGTDGVRGIAGRDLTPELAASLGRAAAIALGGGASSRFLIGRDTRVSGPILEEAIAGGIALAGGEVLLAGIVPSPAVAFLTRDLGTRAGVVISASHNPPEHNGIKFFSEGGTKLPDEVEARIERLVDEWGNGARSGSGVPVEDAEERYLGHLERAAEGSLDGIRLVVDCANGAAWRIAPELYRRLGAEVVPIHAEPDGERINVECGATHPEVVARAVREHGADAGVAHDGDADRVILADAEGTIVDGDQILAALALAARDGGTLPGNVVVSTVMANVGFRQCMKEAGIEAVYTKVGDRYVLEEMVRRGAVLGGEQSGHLIFLDRATTGDGLLTAARFLGLARTRGVTVRELASSMQKYPQVLENVEVTDRDALDGAAPVWEAVRQAEEALGDGGRVLVRPSGTEHLVRVMVEAETEDEAAAHAATIAETVRNVLGR